jgi:hypothetical protein
MSEIGLVITRSPEAETPLRRESGKAWKMADFSGGISGNVVEPMDDRKVFKIYVSGPVLYAVARNAGC